MCWSTSSGPGLAADYIGFIITQSCASLRHAPCTSCHPCALAPKWSWPSGDLLTECHRTSPRPSRKSLNQKLLPYIPQNSCNNTGCVVLQANFTALMEALANSTTVQVVGLQHSSGITGTFHDPPISNLTSPICQLAQVCTGGLKDGLWAACPLWLAGVVLGEPLLLVCKQCQTSWGPACARKCIGLGGQPYLAADVSHVARIPSACFGMFVHGLPAHVRGLKYGLQAALAPVQLTDLVPVSVQRELLYLDVSNNNLTGNIPECLFQGNSTMAVLHLGEGPHIINCLC